MKIALLISLLFITACHSISIQTKDGAIAKVTSFGQKVTIGGLAFEPNTGQLLVTNYNLDQVSGIQAVGALVIQGMQQGAVLAGKAPTNAPASKP